MVTFFLAAFLGALGFQQAWFPAHQQQASARGEFNLKVDVDLVTVDVSVRNEKAAIVGNLKTEDFAVYDNGRQQQITYFSKDQLPLAVALLVDRSASMRPYLLALRQTALAALDHLRQEDQVVLFSFSESSDRLTNLTLDRSEIVKKIEKIKIGRNTNIYGAIYDAARFLRKKAPDRRRIIIMVSDNYNTIQSSRRDTEALNEALESAATLYSIRIQGNDYPYLMRGRSLSGPGASPANVRWIAEQSGGEVLNVRNTTAFSDALESAIKNFKLQYTLGFIPSSPEKDGTFHRLEVRLKNGCEQCRVQARRGYYARAGNH